LRIRTVVVVLVVVVVGIGIGCYGALRLLMPAALKPPPPRPVCVAHADGDATLVPEQMANAATIAAVGIRRGLPVRAVQVALVTAMQESKLKNLSGGDRDSVGLFQQRPSQGWGQPEQLMDARFAAGAFYAALVKVRGWQAMDVGDAAQAVQRSAYPDAYTQWSDPAGVLARALAGVGDGAVACTPAPGSEPRGVAAVEALTAAFRADWGAAGVTAGPGTGEVTVRAADAVAGWRYAYWMVSHAEERGVQQVRVAGLVWTAGDGRWTMASAAPTTLAAPTTAGSVVARLRQGQ
jgi:hypothetical protein